MRKLFYLIIILGVAVACQRRDIPRETEIREAVERQLNDYPSSSLLDLYKSFFQDNFGPGHLAPDSLVARANLEKELAEAGEFDNAYYEPTGMGDNFYRVSLKVLADSIVPFDTYFDAFYSSIKDVKPVDVEKWRAQWTDIAEVIDRMNLDLPDYKRDASTIDSLLNAGGYVWHHSPAYNAQYSPHYRLIRKEIFQSRILPLIESRQEGTIVDPDADNALTPDDIASGPISDTITDTLE